MGEYHAIQEHIGCHHLGGGGADHPWILYKFAPGCEVGVVRFFLLGLDIGDELVIGDLVYWG